MSDADEASERRPRVRPPVPWGEALPLSVLGITRVEIVVLVVLITAGLLVLVPAIMVKANDFSANERHLGIVLVLPEALRDVPVRVHATTYVTILEADGTAYEQVQFVVMDPDTSELAEVLGARVLSAGEDPEDNWPNSPSRWTCGSMLEVADMMMLQTQPMIPFVTELDQDAVKALSTTGEGIEWEVSRTVSVDEIDSTAPVTSSGAGCVTSEAPAGLNDAGNRWFSPTYFHLGIVYSDGGEIAQAGDSTFLFTQDEEVVTPTSWQRVSGFVDASGAEIGGGDYVRDLVEANGYAEVTSPLGIPRPGSVPTMVYIDTVVERGIQQRIQLGWSLLGVAVSLFVGGVVARLAQLRKETVTIL